jgi:sulfur relay (sulfurtransferase) DsrC/TusE family protein
MSILNKVIQSLKQAEKHNSSIMVKPEVILWPDPDLLWEEVIPMLQDELPQLMVYGNYNPEKKQGPAIWLKCMVTKTLPEANWPDGVIPIIYLPGISKNDLRNAEHAELKLQPLLEYQYTGVMFLQENGKEWTIMAFLENIYTGMGAKVAKDKGTKYALKTTLAAIFRSDDIHWEKVIVDSGFLYEQVFPDIDIAVLQWMCNDENFMKQLQSDREEAFVNLCKTQYDFTPDYANIKAIAEKLGAQKGEWKQVWQLYANAPSKYPEIEEYLRLAKPDDLGTGIFAMPEESWPQVNEDNEDELAKGLEKVSKSDHQKALELLNNLEKEHAARRKWVWNELGKAPLANALKFLVQMASLSIQSYASSTIEELNDYYLKEGFMVDQTMRKALAAGKSEKNKSVIVKVIRLFYQPLLTSLTQKFQNLVKNDPTLFTSQSSTDETESFILFADAFRYEMSEEFVKRLQATNNKISLDATWTAIPSLTATSKPAVSPISHKISIQSTITEFRPALENGKDLATQVFRDTMETVGYTFIRNANEIEGDKKYWQETGKIDSQGHEEQAGMVKRIDEFFDQVQETLENAFEKGIKRVKIVTDHGWLLLPGGLPKQELHAGLTETRWGRCALIKEGAETDLLHLPWRWNPSLFVAYAPDIHFFKANVEYAHGGISLQECLVPVIIVENPNAGKALSAAKITEIKWVNLRCTVTTVNADGCILDIRTKYNDKETSVLESKLRKIVDNKGVLMVEDSTEGSSATIVLIDAKNRIIDKKLTIVGV